MCLQGFYEWVPSLPRSAGLDPGRSGAGFSPGAGSQGLLQLSALLSMQSLHASHIHCRLLHPPSWQENAPGPQKSVSNGSMAVPWHMPGPALPS